MTSSADARQYAPATQRNREPILAVLRQVLPPTGSVLEISSGTGEHAVFFAPHIAPRFWQPSDPNPLALESIAAWRSHHPTPNLLPPLALDMCDPTWPVELEEWRQANSSSSPEPIGAIVNINMIHIAPWAACLGLLAGASRILPLGGVLYLYGPYMQQGVATAPSNEQFDQSLRQRDPDWGLRSLEAVIAEAAAQGLELQQVVAMPANNLSVVFEKTT
jgi:hypothetical protein